MGLWDQKINVLNERLLAVDVDIGSKRFRFIATYMPHGGLKDIVVAGV